MSADYIHYIELTFKESVYKWEKVKAVQDVEKVAQDVETDVQKAVIASDVNVDSVDV